MTGGYRLAIGLLMATSASALHAQAGDEASPPPVPESSEAASTDPEQVSGKWQLYTVTYIWAAGAKGDTDVIGPVPPVGLDLSFGKAISNLKFAFMGAAGARKDRLVLLGDFTWIHLDFDEGIKIRDQNFLDGEIDSKTIAVTALGGYRAVDKGPVKVDILGGARLNFSSVGIRLTGPNREAEGKIKQTWVDPLVATRIHVPLGGKIGASAYGDIGGFGIASDLTWQALGTIDYDFNPKMRLSVGWRHFKVDYDKGDFLYSVAQSGPIIWFRTFF